MWLKVFPKTSAIIVRFESISPGHVLDGASFSYGEEVQPAQEAVDGLGLVDVFSWDFSTCPLHRRIQLVERGEGNEGIEFVRFDHPLFRALYLS